jgi:hypothetical protein
MSEYLVVSDAVVPVAESETASAVGGLARALVASKHRVTLLSLAAPELAERIPGMARRLRTVSASAGGVNYELPLFEAQIAQAQLYVLGAPLENRGHTAAILASGAASLAQSGLFKPDVLIGWGETSAVSVSSLGAPRRLFVLPAGTSCPPLTAVERQALGPNAELEALAAESLVSLGAADADAVVVPSPSSRARLERDAAMAARASDQPIVAIRLGCDEAPHDPSSDGSLAAPFSVESPGGKALCRRALARKASLALGPRTLLLVTAPLTEGHHGKAMLEALARIARLDVAVAVRAGGDRTLTDRAAVLAIEHPGKLAVVSDAAAGGERALLAGADAILFGDDDDHTGRAAGLALRYGALPIAAEGGANADYLVDHDEASRTGCALLYSPVEPFEIEAAVRRALTLRTSPDAEVWQNLVPSLLAAAPTWAGTAAALEGLEPPEAVVVLAAVQEPGDTVSRPTLSPGS